MSNHIEPFISLEVTLNNELKLTKRQLELVLADLSTALATIAVKDEEISAWKAEADRHAANYYKQMKKIKVKDEELARVTKERENWYAEIVAAMSVLEDHNSTPENCSVIGGIKALVADLTASRQSEARLREALERIANSTRVGCHQSTPSLNCRAIARNALTTTNTDAKEGSGE